MLQYGQLETRVLGRTEMAGILPSWQQLAGSAAEDNVYYSPAYAMPLLETVAVKEDVRFLTVWREGELAGMLPFVRPRLSLPGLTMRARAWETLYTFNCTPLLSRQGTVEVARAMVAAARQAGGPDWILPCLRVGGPAHAALTAALSQAEVVHLDVSTFRRAFLQGGTDFETHMNVAVGSKRRRELGRNRRKLEELGAVTHEAHLEGAGLARAVEAFLELEHSGWKGRKGTALACGEDTRQFALRAFKSDGGARTRVDLLLLDGKPVAAGVIVFCGATGFTVKGAYDEAYSRQGVGLLLEVEILKSFLTERWAESLDSATAGEHVIDMLWPGRMEVADLAFSFSAIAPRLRINAHERAAGVNRRLRGKVKQLLGMD